MTSTISGTLGVIHHNECNFFTIDYGRYLMTETELLHNEHVIFTEMPYMEKKGLSWASKIGLKREVASYRFKGSEILRDILSFCNLGLDIHDH